jgi:hypothetical protein
MTGIPSISATLDTNGKGDKFYRVLPINAEIQNVMQMFLA